MNDDDKQLAIISGVLALIFNVPLMTLIIIWAMVLICTMGNKNSFMIVLKAMALAAFTWLVGFTVAYYIIY